MCVMPMEVVWRCSAKILEYGIWGQGRYGGWRGEFGVGILAGDSMGEKMYPKGQ
jgi:hypothetical protein